MTTPDTPPVDRTSAGADAVISDGVQEHRASECRWTPSRIYPGHEACLVNGAAHYREAEAAQGAAPHGPFNDWNGVDVCSRCGWRSDEPPYPCEGAAPRAEGLPPIQRLESALKDRATTDGEVVSLMNLLGDALHEARHQTCACSGAAPRAEGLDRLTNPAWLSDELGMHDILSNGKCDCDEWNAYADQGTFNDHLAVAVIAAARRPSDKREPESEAQHG